MLTAAEGLTRLACNGFGLILWGRHIVNLTMKVKITLRENKIYIEVSFSIENSGGF